MATKLKKKEAAGSNMALAGFYRVHIKQDGELVGDSGWCHNTITDFGLKNGLAFLICASAGSALASYAALGTGTAPATNASALPGENTQVTNARDGLLSSVVSAANASGVTARFYGTFASSESRVSNTLAIANIGLYNSSATNAGSVLCGAAYTASTLSTNQDVNYTYEWRFQTTT
jgi:hypothetical protein